MQRRGEVGGGQRPEQRDGGGGGPVAARLDRHEMHRQRVARFGALDVERAGLRVEERELADLRDQVILAADPAGEAVLRPQLEHRRGPDPRDRGRAAEGPRVLIELGPEREYLRVAHVNLRAALSCFVIPLWPNPAPVNNVLARSQPSQKSLKPLVWTSAPEYGARVAASP